MMVCNLNMDILKQVVYGIIDMAIDLWNKIYPCLEIISTIGGCIGFIDFIKNIFHKKIPRPQNFALYIYRKNKWNYNILSEELDISKDEAKTILRLFGYKWNNSEKMYTITEDKKQEKINKINNWDL